jgi:iron complex transport system substrate-binding protein
MNVVTLLPSATEIVCALGHESSLVGRSHECDFPPSIQRLPALTAPKLPVDAPSAEIDRAVKSLLSQALSIYEVDAQRLAALKPDLVVTQSQCDVCAVSEDDVVHALSEASGTPAKIVSLSPKKLDDVFDDLVRVGHALGVPEEGRSVAARLHARVDELRALTSKRSPRPRVACIEWLDPLMAAGNWVPEIVEAAGGQNLFGTAGAHSDWLTWEQLVSARPEVIFVMPCGFGIERAKKEMPERLKELGARVVIVDGNQYFNRPGPRLVDSIELLAEALWGFAFGRRSGWEEA